MAIRAHEPERETVQRIQRHRFAPSRRRNQDSASFVIRGIVRRSNTVEDAIKAVKAVRSAWTDVSPATREAIDLMLAILELSDDAQEAAAVFGRLHAHYPSARAALEKAKKYISAKHPGSEFRLEFGEDDVRLGMSFLYVSVPAKDYPTFKGIYDRVTRWWTKTFPEASGKIVIAPRSGRVDV